MHPSTGSSFAVIVWDVELLLYLVGLAFLIVVGLWCILKAKRWGLGDAHSAQDELAVHQSLLEQGLLTQEEFDRIRARLEAAEPPDGMERSPAQPQDPTQDSGPSK